MGQYSQHWLALEKRIANPPPMFLVNWFRKDANGKFIWPGFGDNMRVLKWILDRASGQVGANETPFGFVPRAADLDLEGLNLSPESLQTLLQVDPADWAAEFESQKELFDKLAATIPAELKQQRERLRAAV
jgi:phosphoenolpyruvate carboxykinase (GTP)